MLESLEKFFRQRVAGLDFVGEKDWNNFHLPNSICLPHYSFAANENSVRSHCRARRWARVSPGASASCRKSEGLSMSRAIPGSDNTTHGFWVARAAAR